MGRNGTLAERLASRIQRGGAEECWPWTGLRNGTGYGVVGVKEGQRWTPRLAHRMVWQQANGPIPEGLCVLHRCDNPPCCNPAHLWLGSHADNVADKVAKGRARGNTARGEASPTAKLSDAEVATIRAIYRAGGIGQRALGARYGVTQAQVHHIVAGKQRATVTA